MGEYISSKWAKMGEYISIKWITLPRCILRFYMIIVKMQDDKVLKLDFIV